MSFFQLALSVMDRLFVITGAIVGGQIPLFISQYVQRLGGHVDELNRLINNIKILADQSNKTLEQYIDKFRASSDPDFSGQGEFMLKLVKRWESLNQALQDLIQSDSWNRLFMFLKGLQGDIASSTWHSFQFGIQLTPEGFVYMAIGAIFGFLLYQLIFKLVISFGKIFKFAYLKCKARVRFYG